MIICEYNDYATARAVDCPAWFDDDGRTNYALKEGDVVHTLCAAKGDGRNTVLISAGVTGIIRNPRTPRLMAPKKRAPRTYLYFANVDVTVDSKTYRIRVPHNALRKVKP